MKKYGEIFIEVRQRVAAFKYFNEWLAPNVSDTAYGHAKEEDYLDDAYRFLYTSASKDFLEFCAKKEGMSLDEYCDMLGVGIGDQEVYT